MKINQISINDNLPKEILLIILNFAHEPEVTEKVCKLWKELSEKVYQQCVNTLKQETNPNLFNEVFTLSNKESSKNKWIYFEKWAKKQKENYKLINVSFAETGDTDHQKVHCLLKELLNS